MMMLRKRILGGHIDDVTKYGNDMFLFGVGWGLGSSRAYYA